MLLLSLVMSSGRPPDRAHTDTLIDHSMTTKLFACQAWATVSQAPLSHWLILVGKLAITGFIWSANFIMGIKPQTMYNLIDE